MLLNGYYETIFLVCPTRDGLYVSNDLNEFGTALDIQVIWLDDPVWPSEVNIRVDFLS